MIPATQRPDGTWRKARKIRTGFNSSSGGATRYVPPAFRNIAGGSGKDGNGLVGDGRARSLGEVAVADGQGGTRQFLNAALFLLTAMHAPSSATTEIEVEPGNREGSGPALSLPLRSAAQAAKIKLRCNDYRVLPPEPRTAAAAAAAAAAPAVPAADPVADPTAATASADITTGPKEFGSSDELLCSSKYETGTSGSSDPVRSDCDQGGNGETSSSSSDAWWTRLRQAERGWIPSDTDQREGSPPPRAAKTWDGESWIGLQLQLRRIDVCCADGQAAIVDFLKGRVGEPVAGTEEEEEEDATDGENDRASFPRGTHPREIPKPVEPTASPAGTMISTAAGGEGEAREGRSRLPRGSSSNKNNDNDQRRPRVGATMADAGARQGPGVDLPHQVVRGEAAVVVAVLVFGSELSKRDRAELHGQAERVGGVASSSHGVGGGRFLSLTCGLGSRAGAVELELSPEQAELARRLFRLAQQEYHSRYECLSHREIREAAFRGGPSAQEHPDLFRLVEKHQQNQGGGDISSPPKKGNRSGSNADTNGATGALVAMKEGTSSSSSEQSGGTIGTTTSEQKNQRLGGAGVDVAKPAASLLPSDGERADEEAPPSRVRGQQGKEWVAVVEEGQKTPEPGGSPEKCPW